uniref:Uncharacterized protein n=1 Tax=virus sp. ctkyY8 TaxID=2827995 RepID=A0A8S5REU1_9VIRU|nr:MAG TPA: hypothetical protein [virus sp. ctkyY8]
MRNFIFQKVLMSVFFFKFCQRKLTVIHTIFNVFWNNVIKQSFFLWDILKFPECTLSFRKNSHPFNSIFIKFHKYKK